MAGVCRQALIGRGGMQDSEKKGGKKGWTIGRLVNIDCPVSCASRPRRQREKPFEDKQQTPRRLLGPLGSRALGRKEGTPAQLFCLPLLNLPLWLAVGLRDGSSGKREGQSPQRRFDEYHGVFSPTLVFRPAAEPGRKRVDVGTQPASLRRPRCPHVAYACKRGGGGGGRTSPPAPAKAQ